MKTPVVLIIYKREDLIKQMMEVLYRIKPETLYLVSDAAKEDDSDSVHAVDAVRKMAENVTWDCQVTRIYAEKNMGCDRRIISGLNEVFSKEDKAIILEDDCIPDTSFFRYCEELLDKYEKDEEVFYISGNHLCSWKEERTSYIFSRRGDTWGWATWSNRWKVMNNSFEKEWENLVSSHVFEKRMGLRSGKAFIKEVERYKFQNITPWDYQWHARCLAYGKKAIVPKVNLVSNVGFDANATHTSESPVGISMERYELRFPLVAPETNRVNKKYDRERQRILFQVSLFTRARRRIKRIVAK